MTADDGTGSASEKSSGAAAAAVDVVATSQQAARRVFSVLNPSRFMMVKLVLDDTEAARAAAMHLTRRIFPPHNIVMEGGRWSVLPPGGGAAGLKFLRGVSGDRSVPIVLLVRCEVDGSVSKTVSKLAQSLRNAVPKGAFAGQFFHLILLGGADSAGVKKSQVFDGGMRLKKAFVKAGAILGSDVVKMQCEPEDMSMALEEWIVTWAEVADGGGERAGEGGETTATSTAAAAAAAAAAAGGGGGGGGGGGAVGG